MFSPQGGPEPAASATVSHLVQSLWARHQATMAGEIHTQQQCRYEYKNTNMPSFSNTEPKIANKLHLASSHENQTATH